MASSSDWDEVSLNSCRFPSSEVSGVLVPDGVSEADSRMDFQDLGGWDDDDEEPGRGEEATDGGKGSGSSLDGGNGQGEATHDGKGSSSPGGGKGSGSGSSNDQWSNWDEEWGKRERFSGCWEPYYYGRLVLTEKEF